METITLITDAMNKIAYNEYMLYLILGGAVLFTLWSIFSQYRSLTHGIALVSGRYNTGSGRGALSHFQALSTALSGTVGLGNIGGVAIAIGMGGPGAVFWMWIIGFFGMALKSAEVMLSMMYRDMSEPTEPRGGPMWVAERAFASLSDDLRRIGTFIGIIFAVFVILAALASGNAFQSFSAADITNEYFGVPMWATSSVLALLVAAVILGGVKRIGSFAGFVVPFMCLAYVAAGIYVLVLAGSDAVLDIFVLIFDSAFSEQEATGAFAGATMGTAFIWGMKRALFSSEAGAGSAPIAHSAVRTKEPVSEGIVAGLEPLIDTLIVCTITALVFLSSDVLHREQGPELKVPVALMKVEATDATAAKDAAESPLAIAKWTIADTDIPEESYQDFPVNKFAYVVVSLDGSKKADNVERLSGAVIERLDPEGVATGRYIKWKSFEPKVKVTANTATNIDELIAQPIILNPVQPVLLTSGGVYRDYVSATFTAKAFDDHVDGLGKWFITIAVLFFALSTIISWSYYGEQAASYIGGRAIILPYRLLYVAVVVLAGFWAGTNAELDNITAAPFGMMLVINVPLTIMFGYQAMRAYRDYIDRLKAGLVEKK